MNNSSFCSDQSEGMFTRAALALLLAPLACAVVRQVKAELRDLDGGWLEGGKYVCTARESSFPIKPRIKLKERNYNAPHSWLSKLGKTCSLFS